MAKTNTDLKEKAQAVQSGQALPAVQFFEKQMRSWWHGNSKRVANLMNGDKKKADKLLLTAMNVVARNPALLECTPDSFGRCLLESAELDLFPGTTQEAAYVPFWNSKARCREAQFIPMYQGLVKLAHNSGQITSISTSVVYDADEFEFIKGTREEIIHKPYLGSYATRGERYCVYCVIGLTSGGHIMRVFPMDFIEGIKARSGAVKKGANSVWNSDSEDDYDAMCCKTALRHTLKLAPRSTKLSKAIELADAAERPDLVTPKIIDVDITSGSQEPDPSEAPKVEAKGSPEPQQPPKEQKNSPPQQPAKE